MDSPATPKINHLLASLGETDFNLLAPDLEAVPMRLGQMLYEPGQQLNHAYFPGTAVVSLHYVTLTGASAEVSGVGSEGVVGLALFLGGHSTSSSAVVHTGGIGWRLDRHRLLHAFALSPSLRQALLRATQSLMTQIAQTAACYRHHSAEQQMSRWLLATLDRMPQPAELVMTQELLASLLGVRRETITQVAGRLQQRGLIRCRRGHISVLDAAGLVESACECYRAMRLELGRLEPAVAIRS
jgi:CRP-like cAMP-binding protein